MEELVVAAGALTKLPFFVPKEKAIFWRILVKQHTIHFGVSLRVMEEVGGAVEKEMEPLANVEAGDLCFGGRKPAAIDRHLLLIFDNSYSKLRSKTVYYQFLTGDEAVSALALGDAMVGSAC